MKKQKYRPFEEELKLFKEKHGNKVTYFPETYQGSATKMKMKCNVCGYEFWMTPNSHLNGYGCPDCGGTRKYTNDEFRKEAEYKFKGKFIFDKTEYINNRTNVTIYCKKHGYFEIMPKLFLSSKYGCPKCKEDALKEENEDKLNKLKEWCGENGMEIDFGHAKYVNNTTKMKLYCHNIDNDGNEHGFFYRDVKHLYRHQGCPKCGTRRSYTLDEFLKEVDKKYNGKYDMSNVTEYVNNSTKIYPICHVKDANGAEHGVFEITPHNFLKDGRNGCPKCGEKIRTDKRRKTTEQFIDEANKTHGVDRYDYTEVGYESATKPVGIICHRKDSNGNEHGIFYQTPDSHIRGAGCPKCANLASKPETEIIQILKDNSIEEIECRNRKMISGEIDIYLPSLKVGFEYDGLLWHSDFSKIRKPFHLLHKLEECEKKGITLYNIFENEYLEKKNVVENFILRRVGKLKTKDVDLTKCAVKEIDKDTASDFIMNNNLTSYSKSCLSIGVEYDGELVYTATFLSRKNNWSTNNLTVRLNYNDDGLFTLMINYFKENYNYDKITVKTDRRWHNEYTDGEILLNGFKQSKKEGPKCYYTIGNQKLFLNKPSIKSKAYKLYDCGRNIYTYENPDKICRGNKL